MATIPDMNADSTFAPLPPIFAQLGLAYDDVLLLPNETDVILSEVDTTTHLTRNITMKVPAISAAMDTVTESDMAIAMARNGGIGVLHRNLSIDDQAAQVDIVKRSESGMINDPLTVSPDVTLADLDKLCGRFHISGLPVVDKDNKLVGIITNRDMRFIASEDYDRLKVSEVMTRENLITGPSNISKEDAHDLLAKHKVEKLPLVDAEGHLTGLITVKDFVKTEQYPDATKDEQGRLRVAAGIGFLGDAYNRASALMEAGVDVLVVDTANGEAKLALDMIRRLKSDSAFDGVDIIGGNVATRQGAQAMIDAANEQGGKLSEVYEVQSGGDTIGYAFKVTASGSQGNIVMIVGVDTDLTVTGVSIVKASETAGIGSKVIDNEATSAGTGALDQFVGKSGAGSLVVKTNIDAVSGATVTTKGITKGANAALAAAEAMA